jgi:glycine/D-amino acid oxidase-like deaminating enzyme
MSSFDKAGLISCSKARDVLSGHKASIQTFAEFNQGMRRPERRRHMDLCGFERACLDWISDANVTPKSYAKFLARRFEEKTNKSAHVVYWQGQRNMDGERGYQFWIKAL